MAAITLVMDLKNPDTLCNYHLVKTQKTVTEGKEEKDVERAGRRAGKGADKERAGVGRGL